MNSIDKIIDKNNIKTLNSANSVELCQCIRDFLVENVLTTGGHLASNLGVVELTLALHKVFDFPEDKIIFDVGHQSYVHKILSGRHHEFATLRKFGGLSGFPKTAESEYDSFNTGHSSTSISAAIGIARARDLQNEDYNVIAFIGDGALGGGMAFEALNDVGANKTKVIIILNDNEMSINHNVGGLSAHLTMLRTNKKYLNAKSKMQGLLGKCGSFGRMITKGIKTIKRAITFATVAAPMFEELGIKYIGIIDGHDIDELTVALEKAKNIDGPVIIHTLTQKGRGYEPAEKNPDLYHGVSAKNKEKLSGIAYTRIFGDYLLSKARENHDIIAITAAMADGCGLNKFASEVSTRFFDVGIAEQHAVTLAAGFASRGMIPVFAVYSTFLQRSYDQLLHDVCMQNLHVVFAIDRAGVVGEDGETHQGLFDLSYLLHMPQMTVLAPSCGDELKQMLDYAIDVCKGPVAIRYPKAIASDRNCAPFIGGKSEVVSSDGADVVIISIGRMTDCCIRVCELLAAKGVKTTHINARCIKPFDAEGIGDFVNQSTLAVTVEDNVIAGGAGECIASCFSRETRSKFIHCGFDDVFVEQGTQAQLFDKHGLAAQDIYKKIIRELKIDE